MACFLLLMGAEGTTIKIQGECKCPIRIVGKPVIAAPLTVIDALQKWQRSRAGTIVLFAAPNALPSAGFVLSCVRWNPNTAKNFVSYARKSVGGVRISVVNTLMTIANAAVKVASLALNPAP